MIYLKFFVSVFDSIIKNLHVLVYLCILVYLTYPWPFRFAVRFPSIRGSDIIDNLIEQTVPNVTHIALNKCIYKDIIEDNSDIYRYPYIDEVIAPQEILSGGEYIPKDCTPKYSTAIIVSYRNREEHLNQFTTYMHNFLRKQKIHYRIFIIEQLDTKPFNRAKLFNIGADIALKLGFPCLIFHDVDLLPLNIGNIYACSKMPRHMSACIDIFRFHLPYEYIMGGVSAIDSDKYKNVNGFSNLYEGWGGEDDDFSFRLSYKKFYIQRFEPTYSRYRMLSHAKEKPNANRVKILKGWLSRVNNDGLNSLKYTEKSRINEPFFTHVFVT